MRGSKGDVALPGQVMIEANRATPQEHDKAAGDAERVGRFGTAAGGRNLTDEVVHPTNWTTPQQDDANNATRASGAMKSLTRDVLSQPWRTPTAMLASIRSEAGMPNTLSGEVGNWSTPRCDEHGQKNSRDDGMALSAQTQAWSTPTVADTMATDGTMRPSREATGRTTDYLARQVAQQEENWGTPTASTTAKGTTVHSSMLAHGHLVAQVEEHSDTHKKMHRLNPDWEELLMAWPIGWTDPSKPCDGIFPGFPAGQGVFQYPYEPARTVHKDDSPGRTKRVSAIGNGVCTLTAERAFYLLLTEAL